MLERKDDTHYVTPVGIAKFPHLVTPDKKFDDRGVYKVDLILSNKDIKDINKQAVELANDFRDKDLKNNPARKNWGFHIPVLEDTDKDGETTGNMVARFKQVAVLKTRDGREIAKTILMFDSKGNRIKDKSINPYSGTKMSVSYTMTPYSNPTGKLYGVTFRLVGVQVIELIEGGHGPDAQALGFTKQDGFVHDLEDEEVSNQETEADTESSEALSSEEKTSNSIDF